MTGRKFTRISRERLEPRLPELRKIKIGGRGRRSSKPRAGAWC